MTGVSLSTVATRSAAGWRRKATCSSLQVITLVGLCKLAANPGMGLAHGGATWGLFMRKSLFLNPKLIRVEGPDSAVNPRIFLPPVLREPLVLHQVVRLQLRRERPARLAAIPGVGLQDVLVLAICREVGRQDVVNLPVQDVRPVKGLVQSPGDFGAFRSDCLFGRC